MRLPEQIPGLVAREDVDLAEHAHRQPEAAPENRATQVLQLVSAGELLFGGAGAGIADRGRAEVDADAAVAEPGQATGIKSRSTAEVEDRIRVAVQEDAVNPG